jgi:phosphoribosyl 1,2-cyclic phosphate phosphodiesterase
MVGCSCLVCRSTDPKDKRLRPSIFVDVPGRARILVDTGTDLRQQALRHGLAEVDAVLYTHGHADHVMGLDDLRRFNVARNEPIPCYADRRTWDTLRRSFYYVFDDIPREGGGIPKLAPHEIDGPFDIGGVRVVPVPLLHGSRPILGFRFGSLAYLTDCSALADEAWPLVTGVDTLVLDALRYRPHPTHFSVAQALATVARIRPRRTYFTHMNHDLPHAETNARLPAGVELAYDGLVLDVEVEAS